VVLGNRATLSSDATWRKWFAWVDKHGLSVRPQTLSDGSRAVHPHFPSSSLNFRLYVNPPPLKPFVHPRLYAARSALFNHRNFFRCAPRTSLASQRHVRRARARLRGDNDRRRRATD